MREWPSSFIIDHDEFRAWEKAYLAKHGICDGCNGFGRVGTRWSRDEGHFYVSCKKACPASIGVALHEPPPLLDLI